MENIEKTTEPLLREYDQARAITAAKIVKTDEGYVLVVQVAWKRGDLIVFNQRGKPRAWVSMDRLLAYLAEVAPSIRHFDLVFDQPIAWEAPKPAAKAPAKKAAAKKRAGAKKGARA